MSDKLTVTTDNRWKQFKYRDEVPKKVLRDQFDWTDKGYEAHGDYSDGFLKYNGFWYHLADFMRLEGGSQFGDWHGYHADGFSSGVVIKLSGDGEEYKIGSYR